MRQNTLFFTFQIRAQKHPDRVGVEDDDGDARTGFHDGHIVWARGE